MSGRAAPSALVLAADTPSARYFLRPFTRGRCASQKTPSAPEAHIPIQRTRLRINALRFCGTITVNSTKTTAGDDAYIGERRDIVLSLTSGNGQPPALASTATAP